jgi:hypothetical protein
MSSRCMSSGSTRCSKCRSRWFTTTTTFSRCRSTWYRRRFRSRRRRRSRCRSSRSRCAGVCASVGAGVGASVGAAVVGAGVGVFAVQEMGRFRCAEIGGAGAGRAGCSGVVGGVE